MLSFPTIRPDVRDFFTIDFTPSAGSATISSVTWTCALAAESPVDDPTPEARLLALPSFQGNATTVLVGTMIDGAVYVLTAAATMSDTRVLVESGVVECALNPTDATVLTVDAIRQQFTALADPSVYSNESIQFWIDQVVNLGMLNGARWGTWLPLGQKLWVAHQAVMDAQVNRSAARGGLALTTGVPTSRSVGGVSVSYDTSLGVEQDAGYFALTPYGNRYWQLAQMVGAGPITV